MTRYARATPPKRVPARPLPRGTSLAAIAAAALLVATSLLSTPEAWIR